MTETADKNYFMAVFVMLFRLLVKCTIKQVLRLVGPIRKWVFQLKFTKIAGSKCVLVKGWVA